MGRGSGPVQGKWMVQMLLNFTLLNNPSFSLFFISLNSSALFLSISAIFPVSISPFILQPIPLRLPLEVQINVPLMPAPVGTSFRTPIDRLGRDALSLSLSKSLYLSKQDHRELFHPCWLDPLFRLAHPWPLTSIVTC